ncbi:PadR family transcriptional regulator [Sphaerisporangium album]|uniref:PadR family transcriptional regulator n=1 Tax=Sphaerisporangium album TaxID=509200 RepID=A0A367FNH1_9ACTN|nr:PadR family transcriptional regulator [Sphaerisporangium album]RCG31918.1 PadR family transcriptional regulator [Sphaerisporangium album]
MVDRTSSPARTLLTRATASVLSALLASPDRALYGLQLLRATGLKSGTLYPMLHRLQARGWLSSHLEDADPEDEGRLRRRYYQLTPAGAELARTRLADLPAHRHPAIPDRQVYPRPDASTAAEHVATAWRDAALQRGDAATDPADQAKWRAVGHVCANILAALQGADPKELLP